MESDPIRKCWIDIKNKDPNNEIKLELLLSLIPQLVRNNSVFNDDFMFYLSLMYLNLLCII